MEESNVVGQQPEDTMLYPLVHTSLEKDLSIPSGSTPSVDDLMNPTKSSNLSLPVASCHETSVIPQQPSSTLPSQQVVSTSITTSGSNPLQVSVKTVPGTNTIVNQALINNIVNSEAVQTLLRDNPGQPITIVRMPETLQLPKVNYPFTPINNLNLNNLKTRKRNGTTLALRGKRARKPKVEGTQEEKTNVLQFQKSLQVKTRSGRVSKPPLYRVKETLRPHSGEQSNKAKDGSVVETEGVTIHSQQDSLPLEATGHTTTPTAAIRGQHTPRRGHRGFRGYSRGRRRARGRVGNFGNRLSSSAKLKELLTEIPDDDLISLTMPRLSEILSPWDFLLMRAFKKRKTEPDKISFATVLKEFEDLLDQLKTVSRECLVSDRETDDQPMVELSGELSGVLGTSKGYICDIRKESLPPNVVKLMESTSESAKSTTVIDEEITDVDAPLLSSELAAAQRMLQVPKCTKIGDKILGVETIFPDNALKSSATNTVVAETAASKLSVPTVKTLIQIQPCSEASVDVGGMIVNVEELDSTVLNSGADDLNLNQTVQPTDSSVHLESEHGALHEPATALSIHDPASSLTETIPLQEPTDTLSNPLPPVVSTLGADSVQDHSTVIQAMVPEALPSPQSLQPATTPMVPEGSTILQMSDGNFLVQKPDGTAMQIQAPEGMTIETIQALLTVETEVFDQGDPERPVAPISVQTTDQVPFLSVEDSVAS